MAVRDRVDIERALLHKGFPHSDRKRDHDYYFFEYRGLSRAVFTKISRGSAYKSYGPSLLAKMAHQLNLSREELLELIDCPMSAEDYSALLVQRGIISPAR